MFRKLLTIGTLVVALIGGIGIASAAGTKYYCPGYGTIWDQVSGKGLTMWVVHSARVFAKSFEDKDGYRKWYFTGKVAECQLADDLPGGGPTYYAAEYDGEWIKKSRLK
ncbi:hypothetical protein [Xenorhabdus griffiniae]|uniref:Lipoprotein n=1 Tax=Xenorhabdus griffiniae TaxID=351672 RepID=A0ABY9XEV7_9GAMM|nr:hypothetical protein [Xenorhabdus griffiniae]MBD1225973.1 hypothetical protein [Xenorhabdus griffiniae]MBE8585909.1 hypothetical protein [Xenorhabdus griffiniae]WMV71451.1 hypothetical protein QL128_14935 [Xenorhabdus griffiniae]WNH01128.1 hypothetical protein QL112_014940 [Xenorhabdus griffiniae]